MASKYLSMGGNTTGNLSLTVGGLLIPIPRTVCDIVTEMLSWYADGTVVAGTTSVTMETHSIAWQHSKQQE